MPDSPRLKRVLLITIIISGSVLYLSMGFGMAGGWVAPLAPAIEIAAAVSAGVLVIAFVLLAIATRNPN